MINLLKDNSSQSSPKLNKFSFGEDWDLGGEI
jgi:hypothetical protein